MLQGSELSVGYCPHGGRLCWWWLWKYVVVVGMDGWSAGLGQGQLEWWWRAESAFASKSVISRLERRTRAAEQRDLVDQRRRKYSSYFQRMSKKKYGN